MDEDLNYKIDELNLDEEEIKKEIQYCNLKINKYLNNLQEKTIEVKSFKNSLVKMFRVFLPSQKNDLETEIISLKHEIQEERRKKWELNYKLKSIKDEKQRLYAKKYVKINKLDSEEEREKEYVQQRDR